jgi:hypothetical protein
MTPVAAVDARRQPFMLQVFQEGQEAAVRYVGWGTFLVSIDDQVYPQLNFILPALHLFYGNGNNFSRGVIPLEPGI